MANKYPLTLNGTNTQIQELQSADELVVGKKLILDTSTVDSAICDASGNPVISLPTTVTSPTGYLRFSNGNGATPTTSITGQGSATNINLNIAGKGTGSVQINGQNISLASSFSTSTAASLTLALSSTATTTATIPSGTVTLVDTSSSQTLTSKTLTAPRFAGGGFIADSNGNELILFPATVTNPVNEITVSNAAAGSAPSISSTGGDTNINLNLTAKGTGDVVVSSGSSLQVVGTTSKSPIIFSASSQALSAATAGAFEYDGSQYFLTNADTTNGKKYVETLTRYQVTANGTLISAVATITDAFPANSSFAFLANSYYEIEYHMYWVRSTTAGTHTYTLVSTQNWQFASLSAEGVFTPGVASSHVNTGAAASLALPASPSMAIGNHYHIVRAYVFTNSTTAGNVRLRVTSSANGITLQRGSFYVVRRLPAASIGAFVA